MADEYMNNGNWEKQSNSSVAEENMQMSDSELDWVGGGVKGGGCLRYVPREAGQVTTLPYTQSTAGGVTKLGAASPIQNDMSLCKSCRNYNNNKCRYSTATAQL